MCWMGRSGGTGLGEMPGAFPTGKPSWKVASPPENVESLRQKSRQSVGLSSALGTSKPVFSPREWPQNPHLKFTALTPCTSGTSSKGGGGGRLGGCCGGRAGLKDRTYRCTPARRISRQAPA